MKQAKKMLCMLLVMLLAFSTVSIGVSAAHTEYRTAASVTGQTNLHEEVYYTTAQRSSQLLDFVDLTLAEANIILDVEVVVIDLTSVDKALDSIKGLKSAADFIGVGNDIGKLDISALGSTRRGTPGKTDLDIVKELLKFLDVNKGLVGKFVRGELNLGIIGSFVNLDIDVHNLLIDMLYEMMIDETYDPDVATVDYNTWTADKILQQFVDTMLLGGTGADGQPVEGFLPSMVNKTNINTETIWGIIENAANAATKDLLLPFIKNDLGALIDELKAENPHDAWKLIDLSKLNLDNYVWGQYDKTNGIVAELNHFLYVVLDQVWTGDKFWVDGGNDKLEENLEKALDVVYEQLGTLILPATSEFITPDEFKALDLQGAVCYVAKQFIKAEMPYVLWEDYYGEPLPCDNLGQIACYIIYSIASDILPTDYMYNVVDGGEGEWGTEYALYMLSDVAAYYLNGALPVSIQYGAGVEQLVSTLVNWALDNKNFGGFFKGCDLANAKTAWDKIDKTVFEVLPLHKIFGGGATGSKDLIMNKILNSLLTLDLDTFLSLLYKADYSHLNKTIPQFVVWLVNNVLNIIVARNTQPAMISTSLTTIDQIIQNNNLAGTAERLLNGLYNAGSLDYFWDSLLPILNPLLIDESEYVYNKIEAPAGYEVNSLATLEERLAYWDTVLDEPDDIYNMNGADWVESVDYELWRYDKVEAAIDDAWDVVDGYYGAEQWVVDATAQLNEANASGDANAITDAQNNLNNANAELNAYKTDTIRYANAAYKIDVYYEKAKAKQNEACQYHLYNVICLADVKEFNEDDYDPVVWEAYQKAYDHAYVLYEMSPTGDDYLPSPDLKQSMINAARKNLLDAMMKLEVKLADMAELLAYYNQVKDTDTSSFPAENVERFDAALAYAADLLGQILTANDQDKVNEALAELKDAFDRLGEIIETIVPELKPVIDSVNVKVEEAGKFISNLVTNLKTNDLKNFVKVENGDLAVETVVDGVVGTGTKLIVKDNDGNEVETYEVVIFGDANGDGIVDAMDTILLDLYTKNDASANYAEGSAQWKALNLDGKSDVNEEDAKILDAYTNFLAPIDQSK